MEMEFKVGDKVKIPKIKSKGASTIKEFLNIFEHLKYDYLTITYVMKQENSYLFRFKEYSSNIVFGLNDLEHYNEDKQMKKQVFLSLETAKEMYKNSDKAIKQFALDNYTKEELEAKELPRSWKELKMVNGFYIQYDSVINSSLNYNISDRHKNIFPTESLAKGALALSQLLQLRNAWWNGWTPKWDDNAKFAIYFDQEDKCTFINNAYRTNQMFVFKTKELAKDFKETFKDLLWEAQEYL